jgi:hypothetical protein
MVHSPKPTIIADGNHQTGARFASGGTIRLGSLEFIADCFANLSLYPEGNDSGAFFVELVHNGSLSLHTILKESINEGGMASSGGGSSGFPISRGCNAMIPTIPIMTTPPSEGTLAPLTIPTVPLRTVVPQLDTGLPLEWSIAYQEEQQARAHARQVDAERRVMQRCGELVDEQATIEA